MCNNMSEFSHFREERENSVILSNQSPKRLAFDVKGNDDNRGSGR